MRIFNGKAKMISNKPSDIFCVFTDASMSGFGAHLGYDWLAGVWHEGLLDVPDHHFSPRPGEWDPGSDINLLEFWPVVAACIRWGRQMRDSRVVIYTDNTQVQQVINTGRSASIRCMWWVRELFWICAVFNIHLTSRRVQGVSNISADFFSRISDPKMLVVPPQLWGSFCCL